MLFRDRFCLRRLLRCYLCFLRNVLKPVLRLTFFLLFRNHFVVPFPISILYFSLVVLVICRFFQTVLVRILSKPLLVREKISVVLGFPGVSNPESLRLFCSVLSRLHLFRVRTISFCFKKFGFSFICSLSGVFQFSQYDEECFFVIFSISWCYH